MKRRRRRYNQDMPFRIIQNDIVMMDVDAIVNSADPHPTFGGGVEAAINMAAGPLLLDERRRHGLLPEGTPIVTDGYRLKARHVIHMVAPVYQGGTENEARRLTTAYRHVLDTCVEHGFQSVAFPLLSAGLYGYPKHEALRIAVAILDPFAVKYGLDMKLVLFDTTAIDLALVMYPNMCDQIEEPRQEQDDFPLAFQYQEFGRKRPPLAQNAIMAELPLTKEPTFMQAVIDWIDGKGYKDPEVYARAHISRQLFSKMTNDIHYQPSKDTAIAICLGLRLDLDDSLDLLKRAGFTLSMSQDRDLIIRYHIEREEYNIVTINITLDDYKLPLLGC